MNHIAEIQNLTVQYGRIKALDNVTLTLEGNTIMIIGGNGSGKSTLVKAMLGLIRPKNGKIRVLGLNPIKQRRQLYKHVTYIGEKDGIPPNIKVKTHLEYLANTHGPRIWDIAETLSLTKHLEKRYMELSRGLQRRLALVEALSTKRRIIILDDPFLGLDIEGRSLLGQILENLARQHGKTILVITHITIPGFTPEKLVILDSGKLLYYGQYDNNLIREKIVSC